MLKTPRVTFRNFEAHGGANIVDMARYITNLIDPGVTWDDLAWLRSIWKGPLVVKGIMRAEDTTRTIEMGCDAIQVSNHGGRQLDHSIATIDALPGVVRGGGRPRAGAARRRHPLQVPCSTGKIKGISRIIWSFGRMHQQCSGKMKDLLGHSLRD